jgi:phosphate starvation-inducible PhoH-like protein
LTITKHISLAGVNPSRIYGHQNGNLRLIEDRFQSKIVGRGDTIQVQGEPEETEQLDLLFSTLVKLVNSGNHLAPEDVALVIDLLHHHPGAAPDPMLPVVVSTQKTVIKPRTLGQQYFVKSLENHDIVFVIGPAGTGKTFLAVGLAVAALLDGSVDRIILTRPAIEAGENLGFLPGDLQEKVDPYLRPLYDALFDILPRDRVHRYLSEKVIEIIPLGYMRGRTLNNAFIILDEGQNTTPLQMKMFLTRLGTASRAIVTGDITQIDLGPKADSGLVTIRSILSKVPRIKFIHLARQDIVRHKLVRDIVRAYEKHEQTGPNENAEKDEK